jgi:hypothetical protein
MEKQQVIDEVKAQKDHTRQKEIIKVSTDNAIRQMVKDKTLTDAQAKAMIEWQ